MTAPQYAVLPPIDTLTFTLAEEALLTNDTVRITVNVHALKRPEMTEGELMAAIQQAVRFFIDAPDWQLSKPRREIQATGNETVVVTATVRVPESENYGLKDRSDRVSQPGLTLSNPIADGSLPIELMQAGESGLRMTLLRRAMEEAEALSDACPSWIVHSIEFGAISERGAAGMGGRATSTWQHVLGHAAPVAAPAPGAMPAPGVSPEQAINTNAARVSMTAAVTLRRVSAS